jgi:hypothetical protein
MKYEQDLKIATDSNKQNKALLQRLKRQKPKNLDNQFHELHDQVFQKIDCLECANCCKTTSPLFQQADIERLAKTLKMKVPEFIETYLKVDDEGDYILTQSPCPFLGNDNKCIVYESRPKACREYPHTNRKRMYQITGITLSNTLICPAVSRIIESLKSVYP